MELDHNQFCCSVCLDLLKEPVTIPCGHSYCKHCIEGCWDQEEETGTYSCPQCRETFTSRPVLRRNNMLAEVVEKLKKSSTHQASPNPPPPPPPAAAAAEACAGPADVACDFCCETRPNKATMSCLTCLASYCPAHLEPHYSVPVLKKHQLVSTTIPLQKKMCEKHNKLMEVYCQTDRKCVCYLCILDEHKQHSTLSAAAEREREQKQLSARQKEVQQRFKEREKELNVLIQALKDFKSCSKTAVKTSDDIFDQLISSMKDKRTLAQKLITDQEKTAIAQAEKLQLQLEEEITSLRRRDAELEQLSHVDDNIHFIQTFKTLSAPCENPDLPCGPPVCPKRWFKSVTDCVSKLKDDMESLLKDTWPKISATVSTIKVVLPPEPKTREDFLRYSCPLTLEKNSAPEYLTISQDYRRVTSTAPRNHYRCYELSESYEYSDSITKLRQVLCREGLSGRCYWEVSLSGRIWSVAVSYKDASDSEFGSNNGSWSLDCSQNGCSFRHNRTAVKASGTKTSKIGVYLDYEADTLAFYKVDSNMMTLLHKEQATFTQPLYPGLGLRNDGSYSSKRYHAELMKLW
uniref:tripartite motif-containing protein 16-like n=1 Tax=Scatophagus argus TaxID=75038 RepID=UPI001ED7DF6C|nr:tripartite motif-containing protein 16-like [Scatophagus argus]